MNYSIIFFTYSTDTSMYSYIQNQISEIESRYSDITIEHVDESDDRYSRFCKKTDRFPAILILKGNARKAIKHSKLNTKDLTDWLDFNLG